MRSKLLIAVGICGLYLSGVTALAGDQVNKASGRFYIVGMGTAPDLLTLRAQKVITSAVILTMGDWPGRSDPNEKLMALGSTMVFYTMGLDYPTVFAQLKRFYCANTPVAVVCNAGDPDRQKVIRSTVGKFLEDVDVHSFPRGRDLLLVGKFLQVGQARKDFLVPRAPLAGGRQ